MDKKLSIINKRNQVIIILIIVLSGLNVLSHLSTNQPINYFIGSIGLIALTITSFIFTLLKKQIYSIMYINTVSVFIVLFISNTQEIFLSNITSLIAVLVLINIYQDWKVTLLGSFLALININYIMFFNPTIMSASTNFDTTISPAFINLSFLLLSSALISQAVLSEGFRKKAEANEEKALHMAYHDPLTGLVNRLKMNQEIEKFMNSMQKEKNFEVAMMIIDLDNFKNVNDTLGHDKGDELLIHIASLLKKSVRTVDIVGRVVGRMGGDEFIVLIPHSPTGSKQKELVEVCKEVAEGILKNLRDPILIDGIDIIKSFKVTASIGIATAPKVAHDSVSLFKYADMAMYHAKRNGKNQFAIFTNEFIQKSV
ncbi:GGDEF domain-containing protein [Bacillus timonensis]|nr:GGDEF domain-containing protein [Bacillus timonensis]